MKKLILLLLTLTLILGVFSSCAPKRYLSIDDETSSSPSKNISEETTEDTIPDVDSEETMYYSSWIPGQDEPYHYSSYNVLLNNLDTENSRIILEKGKWGVRFSRFIDALSERKSVPLFNGRVPPYRDGDQIVIFPIEWNVLPWIWYCCYYNEHYMIIKITYPDAALEKDFSQFKSTSEVLKKISSDAPNIHNADEKKDSWKNIYEKDLLIEGKNISALVYENVDSSDRSLLHFYYDGIFVTIQCNLEALTDEFWQGFSIG